MLASERDEAAREQWRAALPDRDVATLVFVDESGTHLAMTPRAARAPRGERAYGTVPRNWGKNVPLIAALTPSGRGPARTMTGATDALAFEASGRELLVPTLLPRQTVGLDNLGAHKGAAVHRLIEDCGCPLRFLPAYSPDLAPIERAFAKRQEALRRAAARTREALEEAIASALDTITPQDAAAWFRHCGYPLPGHSL